MSYTKILDKLLWWFVTLLLFSFYAMGGDSNGKYVQVGVTIVIAILCVMRYGKKLNFHIASFHIFMSLFLLFCFASYFWTPTPIECLHWCLLIAQSLLCLSIVYIYADHQDSISPLLDSVRWAGYLLTIYLFCVYGWDSLHYMLQESMRMDSDLLNSNTVGILCAFCMILTLYRWIFFKFSISYLFVIPTFLLFSLCSSRSAFGVLIMGCGAVVFIKYFKRNMLSNLINIFFVMLVGVLLLYLFLSLPMLKGMKERLTSILGLFSSNYIQDVSIYYRSIMVKIGIAQFIQTPLLGLGIGSSGILTEPVIGWPCYLHNNYIELLACGGIIGTLTYHLLYIVPGVQLLKNIYSSNKNTLMCCVLIFLLLLMEAGSVPYVSKENYFFILIFFIQVQLNKRHFGERNENNDKQNN